ncbi:hydrogenase 1 cytochrome b subunit [Rhodovastum atsumiense]|uniref:Probable Ni/Fe-hydrogenase B-type cytochrome subunit n=1 Tax=Rhodovastum atsumiense TaxID=504468 RepID=A0A5M6ITD6_9PROT|nr:Ni/Fe-hydrogenase, b-type cytochrome subunit [Rhodovastum atsumiense]KAA5610818.1 Ni/Fe-hydrogenase, b-type cytochrome subunit [Rhodovastum atsumiense]CAH2602136.1 hydrogenase 1 cytochrome b subunit [Rhodovastum atsumiense]
MDEFSRTTRFRGVVDLDPTDRSNGRSTIYVYEAAVRAWHWVHALAMMVLVATGYLIASPPPTLPGEASANFLFGYIRFTHFVSGYVLAISFLFRIYWGFVGNRHSRQIFHLPVWERAWWRGVVWEAKWYLFLVDEPKKYLGHNPLAQITMFFAMTLGTIGMIVTGFALYSEGTGRDSWEYVVFGTLLDVLPSQDVHTLHHLGLWMIVIFTIIHVYASVREEIMSRQTMIATMISGERQFRDDRND